MYFVFKYNSICIYGIWYMYYVHKRFSMISSTHYVNIRIKVFPLIYYASTGAKKKTKEKIKRMKQIFYFFYSKYFLRFLLFFFFLVTKYIIPISINNHKFNLIYFELCYSNPKCYCAFGI